MSALCCSTWKAGVKFISPRSARKARRAEGRLCSFVLFVVEGCLVGQNEVENHPGFFEKYRPFFEKFLHFNVKFRKFFGFIFLKKLSIRIQAGQNNIKIYAKNLT
jgi:hypothetical protein